MKVIAIAIGYLGGLRHAGESFEVPDETKPATWFVPAMSNGKPGAWPVAVALEPAKPEVKEPTVADVLAAVQAGFTDVAAALRVQAVEAPAADTKAKAPKADTKAKPDGTDLA